MHDAKPCNEDLCKLPDCFCSGTKIPGGLAVEDVPQMVTISFDDSVNVQNFYYYKALFNDGETARKNPNGKCWITVETVFNPLSVRPPLLLSRLWYPGYLSSGQAVVPQVHIHCFGVVY